MLQRKIYEAMEFESLAPCALKSAESRGRVHAEEPDPFRPAFLRDRDRVIHCAAFRRLEFKTQVIVHAQGDYFRTRLTHTLEVSQIARSLAYSLQLNEGFVEALSLAHDLGHPPFGHAGQEILSQLMTPYGGFEHNRQGLRIVDHLEKRYPEFEGLNLTYELRESILKHGSTPQEEAAAAFPPHRQPFLETQVVDLADRLAYTHHDLDDGLKAGILDEEGLRQVPLWSWARGEVERSHTNCPPRIRNYRIIDAVVKRIISDTIESSRRELERAAPKSVTEARDQENRLITLSGEMEALCDELNGYLDRHFYQDYRVARMVVRAERILSDLFHGFRRRPETLPPEYQAWIRNTGLERAVCDYVAGMTDRYAEEIWNRLRL